MAALAALDEKCWRLGYVGPVGCGFLFGRSTLLVRVVVDLWLLDVTSTSSTELHIGVAVRLPRGLVPEYDTHWNYL